MWTFRRYIYDHNSDSIRVWYDAQPDEVQAELDAIIELLRVTPRKWWRMPRYRKFTRAGTGLGALRLQETGIHYRIVGFFGPNEEIEFTLLVPLKKADDPAYALAIPEAFERRDVVMWDEERSHECRFP
jgi:hypothetical protein